MICSFVEMKMMKMVVGGSLDGNWQSERNSDEISSVRSFSLCFCFCRLPNITISLLKHNTRLRLLPRVSERESERERVREGSCNAW